MPYISTVERDNIADAERRVVAALQQGRQEGRQEGQAALLLRLIERRFGAVDDDVRAAVDALSPEGSEALAEALFDFGSVDDLRQWLGRR